MRNKDPDFMHWIAGAVGGLIFLVLTSIMTHGVVL